MNIPWKIWNKNKKPKLVIQNPKSVDLRKFNTFSFLSHNYRSKTDGLAKYHSRFGYLPDRMQPISRPFSRNAIASILLAGRSADRIAVVAAEEDYRAVLETILFSGLFIIYYFRFFLYLICV